MNDPITSSQQALHQIEEKVADLKSKIESSKTLKGIDLEKFRKDFENLSQSLKEDLFTEISKIDTHVNDRVSQAIEQLIILGQKVTERDGNTTLAIWRVLDQVKSEVQNQKKKAIVERAGKTELGGGSTEGQK